MEIYKNLISKEFARKYLSDNLQDIIKHKFESFNLEIEQRNAVSVVWFISFKSQLGNSRIVGLFNKSENKNKSYQLARFLTNSNLKFDVYHSRYYDRELKIFFYDFIEGKTLRELVEKKLISFNDGLKAAEKIFKILREISQIQKAPVPQITDLSNLLNLFEKRLGKYSNNFKNIIFRSKSFIQKIDFQKTQLVHGDFQSGNIIFGDIKNFGKATIIDWDEAGLGDGTYDIGSFLAHTDLMFEYHYGKKNSEKFSQLLLKKFPTENKKIKILAAFSYIKIAYFLSPEQHSELIDRIIGKADALMKSI